MHEFSLVSAVIESLEEMSAEKGWGHVKKVILRVGSMRQVIPEAMRFAFNTASVSTSLAGAELELVNVPIAIRCPRCGREWGEEHLGMICPYCGCDDAQMVRGMELDIDSVEVEDDDEEKG